MSIKDEDELKRMYELYKNEILTGTYKKGILIVVCRHSLVVAWDKECHIVRYKDYPWFRDAKVSDVLNVELSEDKEDLHWPSLDIDIHVDALKNPDKYPITFPPNQANGDLGRT